MKSLVSRRCVENHTSCHDDDLGKVTVLVYNDDVDNAVGGIDDAISVMMMILLRH